MAELNGIMDYPMGVNMNPIGKGIVHPLLIIDNENGLITTNDEQMMNTNVFEVEKNDSKLYVSFPNNKVFIGTSYKLD